MELTDVVKELAEYGILFLVMAVAIVYLYIEYRRVSKRLNEVQSESLAMIRENNDKNLDTMITFSNALEKLSAIIKAKRND